MVKCELASRPLLTFDWNVKPPNINRLDKILIEFSNTQKSQELPKNQTNSHYGCVETNTKVSDRLSQNPIVKGLVVYNLFKSGDTWFVSPDKVLRIGSLHHTMNGHKNWKIYNFAPSSQISNWRGIHKYQPKRSRRQNRTKLWPEAVLTPDKSALAERV